MLGAAERLWIQGLSATYCIMDKENFYRHVAQTSSSSIGIEVVKADGIYLYGPNDEKWIDFISGICVSNLGHGLSEIQDAIHKQVDLYLHPAVYGEAIMSPQTQYARLLAEVLGEKLDCIYFGNSGAEAVEGALKIARKFTGRQELISFEKAYHGSTYGAMSVTGSDKKKKGYGPFVPDVKFLRYNVEEDLQKISEDTAAVIIEPIQGAAGVLLPEAGYLQAVRDRCTETGALMIMDEIQTGMGRSGTLFAHQRFGVKPDMLVLAKALGGGLPLSAFIASREIISVIQKDPPLGHLTTYGGHPVCCAAGMAMLRYIIDQKVLENIPALEKILIERLHHPAIKTLRGKGLMYALLFEDFGKAEQVRKKALDLGLLTIGFLSISNGLRICPPLNITEEEMHQSCEILLAAME